MTKIFYTIVIFISAIGFAFAQPTICCQNELGNPGFEDPYVINTQFPDNNSPINSRRADANEWVFEDGSNTDFVWIINDNSRATEGNSFVYIDYDQSQTPPFNHCIGNFMNDVTNCQDDSYIIGLRYVIGYDFVAFNRNNPEGDVGTTTPKLEDNFPQLLPLYESDGTLASSASYTSVSWASVASNWITVAGVTPAYEELSAGSESKIYFSHAKEASCGILMDNTVFEMVSIDDSEATNISISNARTQVTFSVNPVSNVPSGIPNIRYDIAAPNGYTVTPSQGIYNQNTTFTATKNSGVILPSESITFTIADEVNSSICNGSVVIPSSAILPVTITSFGVSSENCITTVEWSAEEIHDFSHYEIQVSQEGRNFETLEIIESESKASSASFVRKLETNPAHKLFRLKLVDLNGYTEYSEVRSFRSECDNFGGFAIYPNPVRRGEIATLSFDNDDVDGQVVITDIAGRVLKSMTLSSVHGGRMEKLDISSLSAGSYNVIFRVGGSVQTTKLIIVE